MPHILKARKTPGTYTFEVCDASPGECPHGDASEDHRIYTWARMFDQAGQEDMTMTTEDMVREIRLLEGEPARAARAAQGIPLPQEGQNLEE